MSEKWHGTTGGYTNHKCRCTACRSVWAEYIKAAKARRAATAKDPNDPRHGTPAFYNNHSCRCAPCTRAHTEAMYEDRKRRTA